MLDARIAKELLEGRRLDQLDPDSAVRKPARTR
jgi:hypothetical protein